MVWLVQWHNRCYRRSGFTVHLQIAVIILLVTRTLGVMFNKFAKQKGLMSPFVRTKWKHVKALANEDTLLRTHCCPWCFLGCANWETFVADTKKNQKHFCVPDTKFVSATTVARADKWGNICVGNNVSSFTRALRLATNNVHVLSQLPVTLLSIFICELVWSGILMRYEARLLSLF